MALRRAYYVSRTNARMIDENLKLHTEKQDLATIKDGEDKDARIINKTIAVNLEEV